jgi:hypothetical protein
MSKPSFIYEIVCCDPEVDYVYIGSTRDFYARKSIHKRDCNIYIDKPSKFNVLYKTINANGGWDNWEMREIERLYDVSKEELKGQEAFYINGYDVKRILNKNRPIWTSYDGKTSKDAIEAGIPLTTFKIKKMEEEIRKLKEENLNLKVENENIKKVLKGCL